MVRFYNILFATMWLAWLVYWYVLSRRVKATVRREPFYSRLARLIPIFLAAALLFPPHLPIPVLNERFLPLASWRVWGGIGATLVFIGLLFTVWARTHLGKNWSGFVTLKKDHELVTSGPYRLVRHPIYTGLLLALIGQAIACGEWRGVIAVVLMLGAFWQKLQIEERWMCEQFGDAYRVYSQRVAALIPFVL